jgi:hypothetical protein
LSVYFYFFRKPCIVYFHIQPFVHASYLACCIPLMRWKHHTRKNRVVNAEIMRFRFKRFCRRNRAFYPLTVPPVYPHPQMQHRASTAAVRHGNPCFHHPMP